MLILGRLSAERKAVLDSLREALLDRGYAPVIFDFEPEQQTLDETIATLAHMSGFVIADLTDAKSVLQELQTIASPFSPSVVVQPLILQSQEEPGMFGFFRQYDWVIRPVRYTDQESLLAELTEKVIAPMEAKAKELALTSARSLRSLTSAPARALFTSTATTHLAYSERYNGAHVPSPIEKYLL